MVSMNLEKVAPKNHNGNATVRPTWWEGLLDGAPIAHQSFSSRSTEQQLFGPDSLQVTVPPWTHFPEPGDEEEMHSTRRVALSGREESALFLKYNYARYRLRESLERNHRHPSPSLRKEMDLWHARMMDCKEKLARANMALVVAMAKRTRIPNVEFPEMVSEGNMALLRSIEKFDVSRGFKFSTYACRSILKSFNRLATKTGRYRRLFPTEYDPEMERTDRDVHRHEIEHRDSIEELREVVLGERAGLNRLERKVLVERYAVGGASDRVRTLAEVGKVVRLTNERVRQIQNTALGKLRAVMAGQTDGQ